ncbi:MAG: isocitrate lyase/phosphoenolpyruvate mutase family protein [Dehalococcoidia bacterium]|nr:isocitrate lyase/phosphoenolpyruvate mutase family protein [Chloroflexota bacterium]
MTFESRKLPGERISTLVEIIKNKGHAIGLEAHSGLSGLVTEKLDFDFIWESSLTDSASKGLPDASIVGNESRIHTIDEILNVTTKPMIVDGDTGGDEDNFRFLIKRLENQGVSAVIVEDKIFPKRNSFGGTVGAGMEDPNIFSKKLEVGMKTKSTNDFLIIARLESLIAGLGMNETMMRAEKYINAGVDGIMIHSKLKEPSEVLEFIPKFEKLCTKLGKRPYLIAVPTTYNTISDDELINSGVDIIIHANHLLRAAYKSMLETASLISNSRRSYESDSNIASVKEIFSAVGYDKIIERDKEKSPNISALIVSAGDHKINNTQRSLNKISDKPLINHQIETFKKSGIDKIKITVNNLSEFDPYLDKDINVVEIKDIEQNQMLNSIMTGIENIEGPAIITYGDILFNNKIISGLVSNENDIVIAVDSSFKYHKHDIDKKLELVSYANPDSNLSRRKLRMTDTFEVKKISKNLNIEEAQSEFFGLAYFSKNGISKLKSCYEEIKKDKTSSVFIDILNFMVKKEIKVSCNEFDGGWIELHTEDDFKLAEKELEN